MKTLTVNQLTDKLRAIKGARAVTISSLTDARARKTGNPYSEVRKFVKTNGFVGVDYSASVERQQAKDDQPVGFQARPHPWGDKVCSAMREHRKTKALYLTLQPKRVIEKPVYFGRNPTSGVLVQVKKETVAAFLPEKRSAAPSQGVENEVLTRDYSLDSITAISGIDDSGETYRIRHESSAQPQSKPSKVAKAKGGYAETKASKGKPFEGKSFGSDGPISEEHCKSSGLRAAINRKVGAVDPSDPMDDGLHPMDQGEHGDHDRD